LRPKGMMLTGGALATALAVAAGPATGATTSRHLGAQPAAAADAPEGAKAPGGAKKPGAKKPDAKKPGAKKPDAKKPGAKKPDAKKPDAKKPDAKKPGAKKPGAKEPGGAKAPGAAKAPNGSVFGGVTPQSWPVVITLNQAHTRVDRVAIGLDVTCTSGQSFGTSDGFKALKLSRTGRFSKVFGPQRIDAGGVPADVESRIVGRIAADHASVHGIWTLKITIYDSTATTVEDTCESGLVRWRARP
jgi:hypothetical protein